MLGDMFPSHQRMTIIGYCLCVCVCVSLSVFLRQTTAYRYLVALGALGVALGLGFSV